MKRLLGYIKKYKFQAICAPLFKLLEACFELLVPLVVADIIDVGIAKGDTAYIYSRGILLMAMAIVGLVCSITAQYFSARIATKVGTSLRDDLFAHILTLSRADIESIGHSTLVTRITNDSNQIQDGVNLFFRLVLRSPFVVLGAMIMAYYVNGFMGLVFAGLIVVLSTIVFAITRITIKGYRAVQGRLDTVLEKTSENLEGVRVIRAFNRQNYEDASFQEASSVLTHEQIVVGRISALMNPLTYVVVDMGWIAVLYFGGQLVDGGLLMQGDVVALVNYMAQILVELLKIATMIVTLSKSAACMHRIEDVFATTNSMIDGSLDASDIVPSVEFRNVGFAYRGAAVDSISDISFTASPGQTIGIIGGTGSGKTTLVNLIEKYYDATSGQILIGGRDIKEYKIASLREVVSIVEQKISLFSGTIKDNLLWGDENARDEELEWAVDSACALDVVASKNHGLDSDVLQQGRNFSGGQRQRLSIARTLARNPKILILDDSTSALDMATDARLRKNIKENYTDRTVFIVSQRVTSILHADSIIVLDDGHMVGIGTHDELMKSCEVYRQIALSQLSEEEAWHA